MPYFLEHLSSSSLESFFSAASSSLHKEPEMFHHCNHPIVQPFWKTSTNTVALPRGIKSPRTAKELSIFNWAANTCCSSDNKAKLSTSIRTELARDFCHDRKSPFTVIHTSLLKSSGSYSPSICSGENLSTWNKCKNSRMYHKFKINNNLRDIIAVQPEFYKAWTFGGKI